MSNISVDYDILNQKQTPAFYASSLATRPAFGFPGRIFIDTDTPSSGIYRDTGSAWVQVADPGAGTTGTLQQVTTNGNTTTLGVTIQGLTIGKGAGTIASNTAIGNLALNSNTTGSGVTAIGSSALQSNTTGQNNIGIGANSLFANTTGGFNTAIGANSLTANTTGINNTALGNFTLSANTTAGNNVGIGYYSLNANTTGAGNTAIGSSSLQLNTTGANNVAIGQSSLTANTTGFSNVGIGSRALTANTTGAQNIAIGPDALYINTTGNTNTAIGTAALSLNTTGGGNTAIGTSALNSNTTANFNTAVGGSSLAANTTGTSNVAIGYLSLNANTTATGNTAIGSQSLYLNTTGASNTAIGVGALQNNTTASTNTAIGSSALQNNSTGTQNTAIGSSALGLNTTAGDNTSIGFAAMQFNTTGTGNTAIGSSSLRANTTFSYNTALGGGALTNALASYNTAIGYGTLQSTTGANNTAVGFNSLQNNTTGANNTSVGYSTLAVNTTGGGNTTFGFASLGSNTTGANNTTIGSSGLALNTTGSNNTTIGNSAGSLITSGSNNTILGNYAGTSTLASNIVLSDGAGNVRLFSDANGLIGINQAVGSTIGGQLDIHTAQTYALVLNGLTTNNAYTAFSNNSVGKWRIGNTYNAGANTFDIYNLGTSSNAFTIINSNNFIGIGVTPTQRLTINGNVAVAGQKGFWFRDDDGFSSSAARRAWVITANYANFGMLSFYGASAAASDPYAGTAFVNFASTGNVLIGSTTDIVGKKLQVSGELVSVNSVIGAYSTTSSTNYGFFNNGIGSLLLTNAGIANVGTFDMSTGIYVATSDINKKKDFEQSTLGLNAILGLKPTLYRMKDENNTNKHLGFIAQEVQEFIPQAFVDNDNFIGLNYNPIVATLVKAIQELNQKLERNNIN